MIVVHNLEELFTFPLYRDRIVVIFDSLGLEGSLPDLGILQLAIGLATVLPCAIVIWANLGARSKLKLWALVVVSATFFANVFLPHIPAALFLGGYAPGLISAVLVVAPYHLLLSYCAARSGLLSGRQLVGGAIAGFALVLPGIAGLLAFSRIFVG